MLAKTLCQQDEIIKPDVIKDYNKSMGGVDTLYTLSRVIKPYSIQKRVKWYRKLGEHFFDIAMYNGFIVWKKLNPEKKESNFQFRMQLIKQIITYHMNYQPKNPGRGEGRQVVIQNPLCLIKLFSR